MLHSVTDYMVLGALLACIYDGAKNGFLKTFLGPAALLLGSLIGLISYYKTHQLITAVIIGILAPILLKFIFNFIPNKNLSPMSRVIGACISLLWNAGILSLMLALILIFPSRWEWFSKIQDDVLKSKSYQIVHAVLGDRIPSKKSDLKQITRLFKDPHQLKKLESTKEFHDFMDDPKVKTILSDEKTAGQLREMNMAQLLINPKIQSLLEDRTLLKKIYALNKKIQDSEE